MTSFERTGAAYLLDKRSGITSRKAAGEVAASWGYGKYGHAGTLDPDATGLLVVLLGRATRLSRFLTGFSKRYVFSLVPGIITDTDDVSGTVLERKPVEVVHRRALLKVLERFTGTHAQKVPSFSAVRIDGERAYEIARKGRKPNTPRRKVRTVDWKLEDLPEGEQLREKGIRLSVTVSSGTYMRALARDIGRELGTGGAAASIRRITVGDFKVDEASSDPGSRSSLLSMAEIMRSYQNIVLEEEQRRTVVHGGAVQSEFEGNLVLLDSEGKFVAVARGDGELLKPFCVLGEV